MLSHTDLKKGVQIILEGEPYEVLEANPIRAAQGKAIIQTRVKNLITGSVFGKNFHQGETFEEAGLEKLEVKFLYSHRDKFGFCEVQNQKNRFELVEEQIGPAGKFLKPSQILPGIKFRDKIINIAIPIKAQLKVTEAPPGTKGDRAQSGTKVAILETGAQINVPLFVEQDDVIEINTEMGEYVRRVE